MISDAALPDRVRPSAHEVEERHRVLYTAARWTPDDLARLGDHLATTGAARLAELSDEGLLDAWRRTVADFRDPGSPARRRLDAALARFCGLSPEGLAAGLEAVLGGVAGAAAGELVRRAAPDDRRPVLIVLSSNLPALAVQPLLPALALRRPTLVKSPTAEPLFAPAFVAALGRREPALAEGLAAVTWRGGDRPLEAPLLERVGRVLAYGEQETLDDLERRAPGRLFGYGPKTSLAVVAEGAEREPTAAGLARDVALFDQRGCLSIQAVYAPPPAEPLADALADGLRRAARRWPPGPLDPVAAAGVQQLRGEARMRGLYQPELPLDVGTVIVEPQPEFRPSPGLRCVRVHPLADLARLPEILAPWAGRLQGAALAGEAALALRPALERLGISRCSAPGELQTPDALWHNGGVHPLAALAGGDPRLARVPR